MFECVPASPIAEGRTAEIYIWDDHHVLKLYRDWSPSYWVDSEARVAHAIYEAGIPSPRAGEIIEADGRRGLIYQRLEGVSMLQDMNARPWMLLKHACSLAELQLSIHRKSIASLPPYKDKLRYDIGATSQLSDDLREKTFAILDSLPVGASVCHGDYHPGNVYLTKNGPVVIDWTTACSGSPWADAARTSLILSIGAKAARKQVRPVLRTITKLFHRTYINHYRALEPDSANELSRWIPVVAAARLNENIIPEREALIRIIEQAKPPGI